MSDIGIELLRTVSNPELHKIDELPEETTIELCKLNRSLTDIVQSSEEPSFTGTKKKTVTNISHDSIGNDDKSDDEDDMQTLSLALESVLIDDENDDEQKLKHSASEPVLKTNNSRKLSVQIDDDDDDDDDIWCNPEDEDNLEHRVKLDKEKEEQLREILGDETLEIVREALKRKESDSQTLTNILPEDKRYLVDTDAL